MGAQKNDELLYARRARNDEKTKGDAFTYKDQLVAAGAICTHATFFRSFEATVGAASSSSSSSARQPQRQLNSPLTVVEKSALVEVLQPRQKFAIVLGIVGGAPGMGERRSTVGL
jgi:hypothetical protein